MKDTERITGFMAKVEVSTFNEVGKIASRRVVDVGAIEADIPEAVDTFLREQVKIASPKEA